MPLRADRVWVALMLMSPALDLAGDGASHRENADAPLVDRHLMDVFNMLLQIREDGNLADAKGRKVDFRNTIIIMTSNIGAARLTQQQALGFDVGGDERKRFETEYEEMCEKVAEEMKRLFKPEFLNRVDKMLVFRPLTREDLRTIVDIQLARMAPRLAEQDLKIEVTDAARDRILAAGYDPEYGARPLRRAIRDLIEDPLSEMLLAGDIQPGDTLHIDAGESDDGLEIRALAIEPVA